MRPGALRGGAAAGPDPRRAGARRARGARPGRADGDPGLALPRRGSGPDGEPILLLDQDRARWDRLLIRRGLAALGAGRASSAARSARTRCRPRSPPATRGARPPRTPTGTRIAALYDALGAGRAVAGRRAQPGRRAVAWRSARRPASSWSTGWRSRAGAAGLPPAAERARRPAGPARPPRRGPRRVRARRALTRNARERDLLLARAADMDRPDTDNRRELTVGIHVHEFMSLDGVIDAPVWSFDYGFDDGPGRGPRRGHRRQPRRSCSAG